jgi:hypothetical protein
MTNRDLEFGIIIPAYGAEYVQMAVSATALPYVARLDG